MMRALILASMLALAGCIASTTTPEGNLFAVCKSLVKTEQALRPFKASLTAEQTATIKGALDIAQPICQKPVGDISDPAAAATAVRIQLGKLLGVQAKVQ